MTGNTGKTGYTGQGGKPNKWFATELGLYNIKETLYEKKFLPQ